MSQAPVPRRSDYVDDRAFIEAILAVLVERGADWCYDEEVSQLEHAVQSALLARSEQGSSEAVAAALLHDIGHFLMADAAQDERNRNRDLRHETVGANWLSHAFVPEVTEPVRLHVPAKRYLCATEPGYWDDLSEGSKISLRKQGGPMNKNEVAAFAMLPGYEAALQLRRIDDRAKVVGLATPPMGSFTEDLLAALKP
ncbi:MAG: HD domain-containing protein [Proteobacteria bacterium]|nr:HD domain-containing protein [Pseudomonadota bacterium]MBT5227605.1 HD domain-containing protein [Pseudomonadota bacterium]MBT5817641.1 HD domain-containing protein [Pseudomonadota bacterium]